MATPSIGLFGANAVSEAVRLSETHIFVGSTKTSRTDKDVESKVSSAIYKSCYASMTSIDSNRQLLPELACLSTIGVGTDWEWAVEHRTSEGVVASRGGWVKHFPHGSYLENPLNDDGNIRQIGVKESAAEIDHESDTFRLYYRMLGRPLRATQVRFYLNIVPSGAHEVLSAIVYALTSWTIPFSLKIPRTEAGFGRSDVLVLYLDRSDAHVATSLITRAYAETRTFFRDKVPLFTLQIKPGLAFAESPTDGDSFGMSRSRLIAAYLMRKRTANDARVLAHGICEHLEDYGVSRDKPYLNPGTSYPYRFKVAA